MVKMSEDKAAMYLVAIVGVVAAVGIIVLLMGAGIGSSIDVSGQAISAGAKTTSTGTELKSGTSTHARTTNDAAACCGANGICWC